MSTPVSGGADGARRDDSTDGTRREDAQNPTEVIDTGRSGAGASSAGRADTGPGTGSGSRDDDGGSSYVPGAYSADEDTSGDYVPGMYSGDSDAGDSSRTNATTSTGAGPDSASTRRQDPTPVSATRQHEPATQVHTQAQTKAVPVSATKHADDDRDRTREHRLPRGAAAGSADVGTRSRSGVPTLDDRKLLHQREKEHFGGMKFGAGFFGWLTATGLFVLLSALVGGLAALFGIGGNLSASDVSSGSAEAQSTGVTAAVVLGVILLVAYFAGGYVAGRMARFSGVKQGVAVWLWAVIVAVVLGIIGLIVGNQSAVTERFQDVGVPSTQDLAGPGLISLLVVAAVALLGAILGGLAGMRYHRRIDRTDFDALEDAA